MAKQWIMVRVSIEVKERLDRIRQARERARLAGQLDREEHEEMESMDALLSFLAGTWERHAARRRR